jgi:hypothetical protein
MKVGLKDLQDLTRQAYLKLGYPEAQTDTILEVLSYAHRRGNFQSLIQEVAVGTPRFNAQREIVVEKETPLSGLIDGGAVNAPSGATRSRSACPRAASLSFWIWLRP